MKLLLILSSLLIASNTLSFFHPHSVTLENIDNLPIIAFFDEIEGEVRCSLYLRTTDNLLGLDGVQISVRHEKDQTTFFGALEIEDDEFYQLSLIDFIIDKEFMTHSWISIRAKSEDLSPENEVEHSCRFIYHVPLSVLYEFSIHNEDNQRYPLLLKFKKKSFITNRMQTPNQKLEPAVKTPVE